MEFQVFLKLIFSMLQITFYITIILQPCKMYVCVCVHVRVYEMNDTQKSK